MKKKLLLVALFATTTISAYFLGTTQSETTETIPDSYINTESEEFFNNYVDMRTVSDFKATENGLMLYTVDGNGYYWER